jgi:hypothetical protein
MVPVYTKAPLRLPLDVENCFNEYEKGDPDDMAITDTEPLVARTLI